MIRPTLQVGEFVKLKSPAHGRRTRARKYGEITDVHPEDGRTCVKWTTVGGGEFYQTHLGRALCKLSPLEALAKEAR